MYRIDNFIESAESMGGEVPGSDSPLMLGVTVAEAKLIQRAFADQTRLEEVRKEWVRDDMRLVERIFTIGRLLVRSG